MGGGRGGVDDQGAVRLGPHDGDFAFVENPLDGLTTDQPGLLDGFIICAGNVFHVFQVYGAGRTSRHLVRFGLAAGPGDQFVLLPVEPEKANGEQGKPEPGLPEMPA